MKFINLTQHTVDIYKEIVDADGKPTGETVLAQSITPSGTVARCEEKAMYCWTHAPTGIDAYRVEYGNVSGLPDAERGVWLIVSAMVRGALPDRPDLCSPGKLLRDGNGKPVGCIGLCINQQR